MIHCGIPWELCGIHWTSPNVRKIVAITLTCIFFYWEKIIKWIKEHLMAIKWSEPHRQTWLQTRWKYSRCCWINNSVIMCSITSYLLRKRKSNQGKEHVQQACANLYDQKNSPSNEVLLIMQNTHGQINAKVNPI